MRNRPQRQEQQVSYITENDQNFAAWARVPLEEWHRLTPMAYLNRMHTVESNHDVRVDSAVVLDDLVCDWMERGHKSPTVMCILRMYDYMHHR
jgi:hypothetical protein